MNTVVVNGKYIQVPDGASISIINDVLIINGVPWEGGEKISGVVKIEVHGSLLSLKADRSVEVHGSVEGNVSCGGSATVGGDVKGNIDSSGSVTCGTVGGNVDAGGSVKCGSVGGSIDAGGSVKHG